MTAGSRSQQGSTPGPGRGNANPDGADPSAIFLVPTRGAAGYILPHARHPLKVISDPQVIMELKAPNKPGVVKSGGDFVYVVMPVNLQ